MPHKSSKVIRTFLSMPNSEKKRWAEDIIRYSGNELHATLSSSKSFQDVNVAYIKFYTEMLVAYKYLGKELPDYVERFST